jgi:hypothetical protein
MIRWFQNRLQIIRLTLQSPAFAALSAVYLILQITLSLVLPARFSVDWVLGWAVLLWLASIEYSAGRKEVFDQTSAAFFKAYLDHLIHEGHGLFDRSEEPDFYLKIGDWQRRAVQGIAIGLGPEESQKFFQTIDFQNPLAAAYKESLRLHSSEPLCRTLQGNLEELEAIRAKAAGPKSFENSGLANTKDRPVQPVENLKLPPSVKQIEGPK